MIVAVVRRFITEELQMRKIEYAYLTVLERIVGIFLLVFPSALLLVKGGMNAVLLFTLIVALIVKLKPPMGVLAVTWRMEFWWYVLAMSGMSLAILASQLANDVLLARPHDAASRFWLAIPVFWLLIRLRKQVFITLQIGFPVAAILGWFFAENTDSEFTLPWMNKILYGDLLLLFGFMSLFIINWLGKDALWLRLLKLIGFVFGLIATFQSGSRGALLAIPFFVVVWIYFRYEKTILKTLIAGFLSTIVLFGLAYLSNQTVNSRINELRNDIVIYEQGNRDTSTGIRWQLYVAAVDVLLRYPSFGVGPEVPGQSDGMVKEIKQMYEEGKLTQVAAEVGICCQIHSEILASAAGLGIVGLLANLSLYFVPMYYFWRSMRAANSEVRHAGLLGVIFVGGYLIFGLSSELTLRLTMTAAFYGFSVAVLLAACYHPEMNVQKE